MPINMRVSTKKDFISRLNSLTKLLNDSDLKQLYNSPKYRTEPERIFWVDPFATSGRRCYMNIEYDGWRYRIHSNTSKLVLRGFVIDLIAGGEPDSISSTQSTGDRVDIAGSKSVRTHLYIYRKPL
jgi:hypothetical protein